MKTTTLQDITEMLAVIVAGAIFWCFDIHAIWVIPVILGTMIGVRLGFALWRTSWRTCECDYLELPSAISDHAAMRHYHNRGDPRRVRVVITSVDPVRPPDRG